MFDQILCKQNLENKSVHNWHKLFLIFSCLLVFVVYLGFNAIAASGVTNTLFPFPTGNVSDSFYIDITPAGWVFSTIWTLIFIQQVNLFNVKSLLNFLINYSKISSRYGQRMASSRIYSEKLKTDPSSIEFMTCSTLEFIQPSFLITWPSFRGCLCGLTNTWG